MKNLETYVNKNFKMCPIMPNAKGRKNCSPTNQGIIIYVEFYKNKKTKLAK